MSDITTTTGESLNSSKMITEMKSIQPFSTKDEYLYAMKEDLAEWFNSMYLTRISAENFIEQLENGVIICNHANSVMKEALKVCKFDAGDLINAGLLSVLNSSSATSLNSTMTARSDNKHLLTPNSKMQLQWSGDYLLFRTDARAQSFQARDNIANFIKWCRFIVKVRECLMFETEDLILRKNEKNFILCLLEVARYGSRFGIQVPTLIKLEQEIEAEIEREKTTVKQQPEPLPIAPPPPVVQHENEHEQLTSTATVSTSCKTLEINMENKFIESSNATTTTTTTTNTATIAAEFYEDKKLNSNGSYDSSSLSNDESMDDLNCLSSNQNEEEEDDDDDDFEEEDKNKSFNDSLENINYINDQHDQNEHTNNVFDNFHNGNQRNLDINTSNTTTTTITTTNLIQSDVLDQQEQLAIISRRRSNENHDTDNNNNNNNNKNDDELDQTKLTMDVNLLNLKDNLNINVNMTMNENSEENQVHTNNNNSNTNSDDLDSDNDDDVKRKQQDTQLKSNSSFGNTSPLIPSPLSTSISSNSSLNCLQMSSVPNMAAIPSIQLTSPTGGDVQNETCHQETNEPEPEKPAPTVESLPPPAPTSSSSRVAKNLNDMFFVKEKQSPTQCNRLEELTVDPSAAKSKNSLRSRSNSRESGLNNVDNIYQSVTNLHRHVCSIADRCTCEKQFPVVKIGEGKYRIGNTKNIVFIRILRNHIMVRVGGGWDTLENYLNKHDPCRCVSDITHSGLKSKNSDNSLLSDHNHHHHHHHHSNNNSNNNHQSSNILLTPVNSTNLATTASSINTTTSTLNATLPSSSTNNLITVVPTNSTTLITPLKTTSNNQFINKTPYSSSSHHHHCNFHHHHHHYQRSTVDFTDAKLVIERNTDGKHVVGKILLTNPSNTSNISDESSILNKSISNSNLNLSNLNATSSGKSILYASTAISSKVDIARNNNNNKNNNNNNSNLNNNNNCEEMNGMVRNSNFITPSKHINNNNSNNFQQQPKQNVLNSQYNNNNSTYQMASHFQQQQQQKQTNKPQFMPNSNSLNAIQSYLIQGPMTPVPASSVKHQVSATFHTPNPPQMQVNLTTLGSSTSGGRTDSLLKNKMKKLINKLPNQMSGSTVTVSARGGMSPARKSASSMSANSTNSSNNNNKHHHQQQQHASMDGGSNTTTTTGYSSLNDDSSSDFLDMTNNHQSVPLKVYNESDLPARLLLRNTPVYTETVLPPRLLRKYEKKRAITEAIIDTSSSSMTATSTTMHPNTTSTETDSSGVDSVSNMSSPPLPLADVEEKAAVTNEHYDENDEEDDLDDRPLSFTKINASSSPQAPPRTKKKYRKSKTTDLTRILKAEVPMVSTTAKPAHEDIDEDDADSLESDYRYEGKLNNSLTAKQFQQQSSTASETNNDRVDDEDEELTKLNDSLESLSHNADIMKKPQSTTIKNDHDEILNDAELTDLLSGADDAINKQQQQPARRLSSSSSMSNLADNDSDGLGMTTDQNTNQSSSSSSSSSKRAQWDKTAVQQFDYKSQLNFQRQKHTPTKSRAQSSNVTADLTVRPNTPKSMLKQTPQVVAHLKATINHGTGGGSNTQLSAKKARNLNMAKAQLYEMKKTIDAKVNLDKLTTTGGSTSNLYTGRATPVRLDQKPTGTATPSSTAAFGRTTPRKVKKRSGERSLTTGLFSPDSSHLELAKNPVVTKKPAMTSRSPAPTNVSNRLSRPTSSSLHNIVLSLNETASTPNGHKARYRRDSCASSASSGTCFSAGAANLSFNLSAFSPQLDYKENKASELRKKSALFNKIINKTQQFDPIYTRSHPICTEINEQQAVNAIHNETAVNYLLANATNIGSYEQHSARRRLFTKKSERFDPNMSLGSNASSSTSTTSSSANVKPAYAAPKLSYMKPTISSNINNIHHVNNIASNNKPRSINSTARSKSNSDIYYTLERTNSTQDLIELMNNCEPPAGDVNRYKLMLDECEKLDRTKSSTGAKPSIRTLKAARRAPTTDLNETITSTTTNNNRQLERSNSNNSINKHRRTHSLPSYAFDIPDIKIDLCDDDH